MPSRREAARGEPLPMANIVDQDVEAMLCKSQPGYFNGEGDNVGRQLEDWLENMDDYFN